MAEFLDEFLDEFGAPDSVSEPIAKIDQTLPTSLQRLYENFGAASWQKGRFQIIDPKRYQYVVDLWAQSLPEEFRHGLIPYCLSGLGEVWVWRRGVGSAFKYLPIFHALLLDERFASEPRPMKSQCFEIEVELFSWMPDGDSKKVKDFEAAKAVLGELSIDQIYAPKLAIPLGGNFELESLQVTSAPDYLQMVTELEPPRVMTTDDLARIAFGADGPQALKAAVKDVR
ncbi:GAD-like domain-containing protein [Thioclava sp. GXIMD4215]|uniref:GAD-like domain-containing protein n=1 Tax=Thioclava sp. GXIMD4215 TaxID=3131928 RepID=UPI0032554B8F